MKVVVEQALSERERAMTGRSLFWRTFMGIFRMRLPCHADPRFRYPFNNQKWMRFMDSAQAPLMRGWGS
jgi:hypothetical protein